MLLTTALSLVLLSSPCNSSSRRSVTLLLKPMVRVSKSSHRSHRGAAYSGARLLRAHFFKLLLLALIGLAACLYFFFLGAELKASGGEGGAVGESSSSLLRMAGGGGNKAMSVGMAAAHTAASILSHRNRPFLLYGTAWKKDRTAELVNQAIHAGFRFIDTACQPRHYNESGVGDGWTTAAQDLKLERQDLFLQTKYSPSGGQDPQSIPYDPKAPYPAQVRQSLAVSLRNLKTTYLDSLVLHSPLTSMEETLEVWREMEKLVDEGSVRRIGISNCYDYDKFTTLYEMARIKPSVLQNRFYQESNFDTQLREFIVEQNSKNNGDNNNNSNDSSSHKIWYQSFWTLTANRDALNHNAEIRAWAARFELTPQQFMFAFLMSLPDGYLTPLSGTTSLQHMAHDVAIMERLQGGEVFFSSRQELERFARLLGMPAL